MSVLGGSPTRGRAAALQLGGFFTLPPPTSHRTNRQTIRIPRRPPYLHLLLRMLRRLLPLSRLYINLNPSSPPIPPKLRLTATMVTLVVATTTDPASAGPASSFLSLPGWRPAPASLPGMDAFSNAGVRLLRHGRGIVEEDDLDRRWEDLTGEKVDEVVFLSKHISAVCKPAITVHPIGVPHLGEGEVPPQGGRPGWAGPPSPRIGPWLRLLKRIAGDRGLLPEFEITLEATHHGPVVNTSTFFVEIGSTEDYWGRKDAAEAVAALLWQGLGLDGNGGIGVWNRENVSNKILFGIGGGHYVPRHMDVVLKDGVWVGHLLSGYSLPMEEPKQKGVQDHNSIGGRWREAILASYEATKITFPGGEILAHLDHKSFKSWQKSAITSFLDEQKIGIGKPGDFLPGV